MRCLEVCVDDVAGLAAAAEGGADRIELCSSLGIGGLTPSAGLMAEAARLTIPVIALIRPRGGDFTYGAGDERAMLHDIEWAAESGLAGVALGAMTNGGLLDVAMLQRLARQARGLQLTLHRAFDLVRDPSAALEEAITLGFHRVLTSGGAPKAEDGTARLASLAAQSQGRIRILAGGGITAGNVEALVRATGVHEVHASCRAPAPPSPPGMVAFGFAELSPRLTSAARVKALKARIRALPEPGHSAG